MKNGKTRVLSICKTCHSTNTVQRGKKNRDRYIQYLGGKCSKCGYSACYEALDFHHLDPTQKDTKVSSMRYWTMEKAKVELDKCIILCANCHREEHYGVVVQR